MRTRKDKVTRVISFYNKLELPGFEDNPYTAAYMTKFDLKGRLKALFNPIPKVINTLSILALRSLVLESTEDKGAVEYLNSMFKANDYNSVLYDILYWLFVSKKAVVEVVQTGDTEDNIELVVHDSRAVDIKMDGKKVIYAKISGYIDVFNKETKVFSVENVVKEYFDVEDYQKVVTTDAKGDKTDVDLPGGIIPIAVMQLTDFNIDHLVDLTDEHNQEFFWLKKVFALHGNSPLVAEGVEGEIVKDNNSANIDDYTGVNFYQLGNGTLKYIEMTGNVAALIMKQLEAFEKAIKTDFPEYALADLVNGSAIAEETSKIQLIEVISRVNRVRQSVDTGLQTIYKIIAALRGLTTPNIKNNFGSVLPTSINELMVVLKTLRELCVLSKETAIEKVVSTGYINSVEEEVQRLKDEGIWGLTSASAKSAGTTPTSTVVKDATVKDNTVVTNEQTKRVSPDTSGKRTDKSL